MNFVNVKPCACEPKTFFIDGNKAVTYGHYMVTNYSKSFVGIYTSEDYYKKDLVLCFHDWNQAADVAHQLQMAYEIGYCEGSNN